MFNGIWLVATEPLTIQGRDVAAGERFHISRVHSGALLVTGRATIAHPQPPPKARTPEPPKPEPTPRRRRRTTTKAEDEPAPDPDPPSETPESPAMPEPEPVRPALAVDDEPIVIPARRYHRRDLEAEE